MKACFLVFFAIGILVPISAEGLTGGNDVAIAVNPLKIVFSLINAEIDYCPIDELSLHAFFEYLIDDYIVEREDHPDIVFRIGPRYRPELLGSRYDTYIGPFFSYSASSVNDDGGIEIGAEIGGRYELKKRVFVQLKGMVMYSMSSGKLLPGFEGLLGYAIELPPNARLDPRGRRAAPHLSDFSPAPQSGMRQSAGLPRFSR